MNANKQHNIQQEGRNHPPFFLILRKDKTMNNATNFQPFNSPEVTNKKIDMCEFKETTKGQRQMFNDENNTQEMMRMIREMYCMMKLMSKATSDKKEKPKKEVKFNQYSKNIIALLDDGKIWCIDAVYEELKNKGIKVTSRNSVTNVLCTMQTKGLIARIAHGTYRKNGFTTLSESK